MTISSFHIIHVQVPSRWRWTVTAPGARRACSSGRRRHPELLHLSQSHPVHFPYMETESEVYSTSHTEIKYTGRLVRSETLVGSKTWKNIQDYVSRGTSPQVPFQTHSHSQTIK